MSAGQSEIALDEQGRNKQLKSLFLFVVGLRDLKIAKSCFDDLKDLPIGEVAEINNVGKVFAFIICYGRIFHRNKGVGRLERSFLEKLSRDEQLMHDSLMNMRNKSYAHNDPEQNILFVHIDESKIHAVANLRYSVLSHSQQIISSLL